jgi:hypothetical protein
MATKQIHHVGASLPTLQFPRPKSYVKLYQHSRREYDISLFVMMSFEEESPAMENLKQNVVSKNYKVS